VCFVFDFGMHTFGFVTDACVLFMTRVACSAVFGGCLACFSDSFPFQ